MKIHHHHYKGRSIATQANQVGETWRAAFQIEGASAVQAEGAPSARDECEAHADALGQAMAAIDATCR